MENLEKKILQMYNEQFSEEAIMIKSPGRINLIGEHLDYNKGFVFPAAIDKYIVGAISKSESKYCKVVAVDMNEEIEFSLVDIKPIENGGWRNYILGVVHGILEKGKKLAPFNFVFGGDIPAGSGLSSSAALENCVAFALNELFDLGLSKEEMILISQKAEHNFVGVQCGIMDQFASMFGEEQSFLYLDCRSLKAVPYKASLEGYDFVLINSNVSHSLADSEYNDRRNVCQDISDRLGVEALRDVSFEALKTLKGEISEVNYQKGLYVLEEIERTKQAVIALENNNAEVLGKLLFQSHRGLQHQYKTSCEELDFLVDLAEANENVIGSRMMGGGFGGCTINLVSEAHKKDFIKQTEEAYFKKYGKDCTVVEVEISRGTHRISV